MKCPNCGNEMQDDHLYCEHCGKEIQIVPDFEPEIENSITQTLTDVAEALEKAGLAEKQKKQGPEWLTKLQKLSLRQRIRIGIGIIILFAVLPACGTYLFFSHSVTHQLKVADTFLMQERYGEALNRLDRAYALDPQNLSILYARAQVCFQQGDEASCINGLLYLTTASADNSELLKQTYQRLAEIYSLHNDYASVSDLLKKCDNQEIRNILKDYLAEPPEFNYVEGSYDDVIPLKLSDFGTGKIFYTIDGSIPTEESPEYTTPIFLENGDYVVRAIFVNQFGIRSEEVKCTYHIELTIPAAPEVDMYSGDYNQATLITVEAAEGCKVYYTTNGVDPTDASTLYSGPIPMPLGDSTLKVVAYSEYGVPSDIIERSYHLVLDTDLRVADAIQRVYNFQLLLGKIIDPEGHTPDFVGIYSYRLFYCIPVQDLGDYYMIYEFYEDALGNKNRTGQIYAVSLQEGTISKATYERDGTYVIEGVETRSDEDAVVTESIGAEG